MRPSLVGELAARLQDAELDDDAERHARLGTLAAYNLERRGRQRPHSVDARLRGRRIVGVALDAEPAPAQPLGHGAGGAGAEERVEHQVAGVGGGEQHAVSRASGFCVGCALRPAASLSRSGPAQIGKSQSERICRSSLRAFMAS